MGGGLSTKKALIRLYRNIITKAAVKRLYVEGKPVFVVDCGSGHSSIMKYTASSDGTVTRHAEIAMTTGGRGILVDALVAGTEKQWVAELSAKTARECRIIVAATAGVRSALALGKITDEHLQSLKAVLSIEFNNSDDVIFKVMTPLCEGHAEFEAAKYCAFINTIGGGKGVQSLKSLSPLSMISAGGMSMQLASPPVGPLSIKCDSFAGTDMVREKGVGTDGLGGGIACWVDSVQLGKVKSDLEDAKAVSLKGDFIGIECVALAATWVSVGERWISARDFVAMIDSFVSKTAAPLIGQKLPIKERKPCFKIACTLQIKAFILAALHPSSRIFSSKKWLPLAPDWTLGVFLQNIAYSLKGVEV